MNPQPYAQDSHLDIQLALAEARREGATQATVAFNHSTKSAVVTDNRNPGGPHSRTINTNIHPASGYQWEPASKTRDHLAPKGLETSVVLTYAGGRTHEQRVLNVGEDVLAEAQSAGGRYTVYITPHRRYPPVTALYPDGTSGPLQSIQNTFSYHSTNDRSPGTEVSKHQLSAIVTAPGSRITQDDHSLISGVIAELAAQHISDTGEKSGGYAWPENWLADLISEHCPNHREFAKPASTSEYYVQSPDGGKTLSTRTTPENAVVCDYDTVQTDLLDYVVATHAPRDVKPVRTRDPKVPAIRLLSASVENLDGSRTEYPVNLWDMETQSGRQDNRPQPHGDRLPHSRIGRVRRIELTMEIRRQNNDESDVFSFETDVYADQDLMNHLLLITEDSTVSKKQLRHIAFLHEPRNHHLSWETRNAMDDSLSEHYDEYIVDVLLNGPQEAARRVLKKTADVLEAMCLDNLQAGARNTVEALSELGSVSITLKGS